MLNCIKKLTKLVNDPILVGNVPVKQIIIINKCACHISIYT